MTFFLKLLLCFIFLYNILKKNKYWPEASLLVDDPSEEEREINEDEIEIENPWKNFTKIFDVPANHRSGVLVDLGGEFMSTKFKKMVRYPNGKCPVFGKVIKNTTAELDDLVEKLFAENTKLNNLVSSGSKLDGRRNIILSSKNESSILDCSKYARNFEHLVDKSENNNCLSKTNKGKCLNHPFMFSLKDQICYVVYPLQQFKIIDNNRYIYEVMKNQFNDDVVYGSAYIRDDWEEACPVKVIKGAAFGKWEKNKCVELPDTRLGHSYIVAEDCGRQLFEFSSHDFPNISKGENKLTGRNWASFFENGGCEFYSEVPDCFYNVYEGYSFTSVGMASLEHYDLPPCFNGSKDWVINAKCGNNPKQNYTCDGNLWVGKNNAKISKCDSSDLWANIQDYSKLINGTKERVSPDHVPESEKRESEEHPSQKIDESKESPSQEIDESEKRPSEEMNESEMPPSQEMNESEMPRDEEKGESEIRGDKEKGESERRREQEKGESDMRPNQQTHESEIRRNQQTDESKIRPKQEKRESELRRNQEIPENISTSKPSNSTSVPSSCEIVKISHRIIIGIVTLITIVIFI